MSSIANAPVLVNASAMRRTARSECPDGDHLGRALALAALLACAPARAQDPLLGETRLDLVRGPLLTSSRIMGLGGAFVAVAEGIDGVHLNPAAFANRPAR